MDSYRIGDIDVWRVEEWQGEFLPPDEMFTGFSRELFEQHAAEFTPDFYRAERDRYFGFLQSWLLEVNGTRILFDTGAGNDKHRPGIPLFAGLQTAFLQRLADCGVRLDDIDIVVCSHLHVDHVGWNTRLVDERWVPTFPRARYLFSAVDRAVWDPEIPEPSPSEVGAAVNQQVFEDSVAPLLRAGRAELVCDELEVMPGIRLIPAPGHTPGHLMMHVTSAGEHALFVGDILHHPIQARYPEWNSVFCEDPVQARQTRRDMLHKAALLDALIFPAHFGGQHCFRVKRHGNMFTPDLYPLDWRQTS